MKSNKMLMKQNNAGFTLVNVLIVIAVIAILSVGAYPVFSTLIEKSWEAADISGVRSAFDHVSAEALMGNKTASVTVDLKQKQGCGRHEQLERRCVAGRKLRRFLRGRRRRGAHMERRSGCQAPISV